MGLSFSHLLIVLVVVILVFGAGRVPKIMGDVAKGLRAFREGMKEDDKKEEDLRHLSRPQDAKDPEARS